MVDGICRWDDVKKTIDEQQEKGITMSAINDIRKERDRLTKRISRLNIKANNDEVNECDALEDLSNWRGWRDALTWALSKIHGRCEMTPPFRNVSSWAKEIQDNKLHHIGEFYSAQYKKPFQKKSGELTKGFLDWLLRQNSNALCESLSHNFEMMRDTVPMAFFIRRKSVTTAPQPLPYPHCKPGCHFVKDGKCKYREMHTPTIAVDFDKVLFTHESWQGHQQVGDPIPGAREALAELQQMGFKIMIWTTRNQRDIIAAACELHKIPFDYINHNPNQPSEINPSKPVADYYIDDRAVRFTYWKDTLSEIKSREITDPFYRRGE